MVPGEALRIGAGAGFSADRLDPAVDLVERGRLDALVFECLGERTLAQSMAQRRLNPQHGYNALLERRLRAVLSSCRRQGICVLTNMGAANPSAAGRAAIGVARDLGLTGLKVAVVSGDEVSERIAADTPLWEGGLAGDKGALICANAYLGSEALLPALSEGADVVIAGRVSDPALFLAPMRHRFGWAEDDWAVLGAGTAMAHLLECAGQVTGGYFADPGYKDVAGLAYLGFPFADIQSDGSGTLSKLADAGGLVDVRTVKEQLLYEIHDPARYETPDVTADFSSVVLRQEGSDRVFVGGATGTERPPELKATLAFDGGFHAEAGLSYAGPGALARAELAAAIVEERMRQVHGMEGPLRIDVIGASSLHATAMNYPTAGLDVRLHCALRSALRDEAEMLLWEVESLLCCGPAGGGGYRGAVHAAIATYSASISRQHVRPEWEMLVA